VIVSCMRPQILKCYFPSVITWHDRPMTQALRLLLWGAAAKQQSTLEPYHNLQCLILILYKYVDSSVCTGLPLKVVLPRFQISHQRRRSRLSKISSSMFGIIECYASSDLTTYLFSFCGKCAAPRLIRSCALTSRSLAG
jgi:hypothetical protein